MKLISIVVSVLCSLIAQAQTKAIIAKTDTSITFVVDENLPLPQKNYYDSSREDVLYYCCVSAYADHHPLVLSPDMIWITICQGFSKYVNAHAEELHNKFVEHDGKATLKIELKKQHKKEARRRASFFVLFFDSCRIRNR